MPTATATRGAAKAKAAPVVTRAFRVGAQSQDELQYDNTTSTSATTTKLPNLVVEPTGFLRHFYLLVQGTCTGNTATVTAAADGPWNVIDTLVFNDVGNQPIFGPMGGYDLYLVNKYGGYDFNDDPRNSPVYSYTTGTATGAGSFAFTLRIPFEICPRDGLGSLPNKSANAAYRLEITLAATTTVYGTDPTVAPSVRTRIQPVSWWEPDPTDLAGRPQAQYPPAIQTTQRWIKNPYTIGAGAFRQPLEGLGWPVRNLLFYLVDSNASRTQGESDWPDPFNIRLDKIELMSRLKLVWQDVVARSYGYGAALSDSAASAKDNGVYPLPFNVDFGAKPGWDTRRGLLPTSPSTRLDLHGTIGGSGSHTLTVLMNYVVPASGDDAAITV